jgi:hypothetical protein
MIAKAIVARMIPRRLAKKEGRPEAAFDLLR